MKTYNLKSTLRNARRNGLLTFAKLFGISISFAVILFSTAYVYFETSFDKHVPGHANIYRCIMYGEINGNSEDFAVTSPAMAEAITRDLPEIDTAIRIKPGGGSTLFHKNEILGDHQLLFADPGFFSFFGIPVKKSLPDIFETPYHLAVSKSLALNHFGSIDEALNKEIDLRGDKCVITAVFDDLSENFHLQYDVIQSLEKTDPDNVGWGSQDYYTYFRTFEPVKDRDALDFKLTKTVFNYWDDRIDGANAKSWEDLKYAEDIYVFFTAEPLADIHFSSHKFDPAITASKTYVYGAIILSILILIISSINYVNLTIANLSTRFKDLGLRKILGAYNLQLTAQYLLESVLFWITGFICAVIIYFYTAPPLADYLNFNINISNIVLIKIITLIFLILMVFHLITIVFPISYFSNKHVLHLIKEKNPVRKGISLKSSFVFLQFVFSALIILSTVIVQKQISYMVNKDRGYDTENIIMFSVWELDPEKRRSFLDELKSYEPVKYAATSTRYFGEDMGMSSAYFETEEDQNYFHTTVLPVDDEFLRTFNFNLAEGSFFNKEKQTDFTSAIINQTAANEYKGKDSLIGKKLILGGDNYTITGIVQDFNFRSLYHKIQPLVITRIENMGNVYLKVNNNRIAEAVNILEEKWNKFDISRPLSYTFHDEVVAAHYSRDQKAKKLLLLLSIISISIACVGLYAISYFMIVRKTKEIGIRKVNGASFRNILFMLNYQFSRWIVLAFIISIPVAWYLMDRWLQNFAYKTALNWWIFASAGLAMLLLALLTVSWQTWKAARRNPVEVLRYE